MDMVRNHQEIVLKEHQSESYALSPSEVKALLQAENKYVRLQPTTTEGTYQLQASHYVGFIILPTGRTVDIRPKVEIDVLFYMLAKAHGLAHFQPEVHGYRSVADLFEFVVNYFVTVVEDLAAQGILQDFVPVEEERRTVRGKVLLAETLRQRPVVRDRHWCRYVSFTPDVAENQILKLAVRGLFAFRYEQFPDLNGRLHRLIRLFVDVQPETEVDHLFSRLAYHRLNEHYRPALALARLLLAHLSPSGATGAIPFPAFLVDMNRLFEAYVSVVLQEQVPGTGLRLAVQDARHLDYGPSPIIPVRPDVVFYRDELPLAVLDVKYKRSRPGDDVYQVVAYCHAFGTHKAILVYPAVESASGQGKRHRIRSHGRLEVTVIPLDLSGSIASLHRQTSAFIRQVLQEVDYTNWSPS